MMYFILNLLLWTLAIYGLYEIINKLICYFKFKRVNINDTYVIIAVKNAEKYIECYIRSIIFKMLYGCEDLCDHIIILDLNSEDNTMEIIKKMEMDYDCIKVMNWDDCKIFLDKYNC